MVKRLGCREVYGIENVLGELFVCPKLKSQLVLKILRSLRRCYLVAKSVQ